MKEVAPGVWQFSFIRANAFNAYYVQGENESIVVDAAIRWSWPAMKRQLRDRPLTGMLLTHAHPDHQGCAAKICKTHRVPLIVHEQDAESAAGYAPLVRQNPVWEIVGNIIWAGKRSPVGRTLREGDRIAGFTVHHTPGHTRGHLTLFRESDRLAIVGDLINTNDHFGLVPSLREPPQTFSADPAENRRSIRKLWALQPLTVCAGHGPVLRDMHKLEKFVATLK